MQKQKSMHMHDPSLATNAVFAGKLKVEGHASLQAHDECLMQPRPGM
jgi:hypothetical protein